MERRAWRLSILFLIACSVLLVPAAGRSAAADQGKKPRAREFRIPIGSVLIVQLRTPISSASNQIDDQVDATLAKAFVQDGVELIPAGSLVHGTIEDVVPASPKVARGRVTMAFAVVQHAATRSRAAIRTRSLTIEAEEPAKGSETGRRSQKQPNDVELPVGHQLLLTLADSLTVVIPTAAPATAR